LKQEKSIEIKEESESINSSGHDQKVPEALQAFVDNLPQECEIRMDAILDLRSGAPRELGGNYESPNVRPGSKIILIQWAVDIDEYSNVDKYGYWFEFKPSQEDGITGWVTTDELVNCESLTE
jgi:hypothetical protein